MILLILILVIYISCCICLSIFAKSTHKKKVYYYTQFQKACEYLMKEDDYTIPLDLSLLPKDVKYDVQLTDDLIYIKAFPLLDDYGSTFSCTIDLNNHKTFGELKKGLSLKEYSNHIFSIYSVYILLISVLITIGILFILFIFLLLLHIVFSNIFMKLYK